MEYWSYFLPSDSDWNIVSFWSWAYLLVLRVLRPLDLDSYYTRGSPGSLAFSASITIHPLSYNIYLHVFTYVCYVCAQLCPTFCNPMKYNPPASSIHGIFQTRIFQWVAISSSSGSSWPRDGTCYSCVSGTTGRFFTTEPSGKIYEDFRYVCACVYIYIDHFHIIYIFTYICIYIWYRYIHILLVLFP